MSVVTIGLDLAKTVFQVHGVDEKGVAVLRKRGDIPTAKINGVEYNPLRWPDGSYSIHPRLPRGATLWSDLSATSLPRRRRAISRV